MTQTQIADIAGHLFPFTSPENLSITIKEESFFGENETVMELPVNNYLKTPQEIQMEFQYGINPRKNGGYDRKSIANRQGSMTITTDGYVNIQNLDETLSGFMEENY